MDEKNLLSTGDVSTEFVVCLLARCRGNQYSAVRHHTDRSVEVHIFRPVIASNDLSVQWYVKLYFHGGTIFISVHPSLRAPGRLGR